tara:strand:- start:41 stop:196 length:156 start_codon:yes stop_codon:yes gene_type:complete
MITWFGFLLFDIYLLYLAYLYPPMIIWLGIGIFAITSGLIGFAKDVFNGKK